mmetsp:Transcript_24077/g.67001  ORF Transcript_24077/g.67001 Transcript_24077/m.67001 type:complete len:221 (+) Transcript_24077:632-1294(+)
MDDFVPEQPHPIDCGRRTQDREGFADLPHVGDANVGLVEDRDAAWRKRLQHTPRSLHEPRLPGLQRRRELLHLGGVWERREHEGAGGNDAWFLQPLDRVTADHLAPEAPRLVATSLDERRCGGKRAVGHLRVVLRPSAAAAFTSEFSLTSSFACILAGASASRLPVNIARGRLTDAAALAGRRSRMASVAALPGQPSCKDGSTNGAQPGGRGERARRANN